jgi:hypothetical protein
MIMAGLMSQPLDIVSVAGRNSVGFLETAFRLYDEGRLFAIARKDVDLDRFPGLRTVERIDTDARRGWVRLHHTPGSGDAPAQAVFTSGTEGLPKAIVISAGNLGDVTARLNAAMDVTAEIREYIGVPVTYSFGLGRARAVAAAGGAMFLPDAFDPRQIRAMLDADEINAISAVPSLWRVVLMHPQAIGEAGHKVRWIEIGSQYMSQAEKEGMKALFPNARILQHYGLTEASRSTFLDISTEEGEALESVGRAVGEVEIAIDAEGAVRIRGPHVACGRVADGGELTPLTDADGWLTTSDRGEIRDGLLFYGGRMDDQINIGGVKFAAEALERDIAEMVSGAAGGFAVAAIPDALRGEIPLLAREARMQEKAELLEAALRAALRRKGVEAGAMATLDLDALPRTETNKVRRRDLRDLHAAQAAAAPVAAGESFAHNDPRMAALAEIWARILGAKGVSAGMAFHDLGGDSLSGLQAALTMEAAGFSQQQVRATLEGRTLAQVIAAGADEPGQIDAELPPRTVFNWAINAARGLMVLVVMLGHWGPGAFMRFGEAGREVALALLPVYRLGTPGFAMVFGVGIGFFVLPVWATRPRATSRRMLALAALCAIGLGIIGVARLGEDMMRGVPIGPGGAVSEFHNVLAYYMLALASAPLWLAGLSGLRARSPEMFLPALCALGAALWGAWIVVENALPAETFDGVVEWPRLMLVAKYSVLRMSAIVMAGVALGTWLAGREDPLLAGRQIALVGGAAAAALGISLAEAHPGLLEYPPQSITFWGMQMTLAYLALTAAALGLLLMAVGAWGRMGAAGRAPIKALTVCGALSLPFFAFHSAVIPVKGMLEAAGLSGTLALLLPLGLFLAGGAWAALKVHDAYFPRGAAAPSPSASA